jgi:hypothetical protein
MIVFPDYIDLWLAHCCCDIVSGCWLVSAKLTMMFWC